eukprot:4289769-Amphidinium_carterae.1
MRSGRCVFSSENSSSHRSGHGRTIGVIGILAWGVGVWEEVGCLHTSDEVGAPCDLQQLLRTPWKLKGQSWIVPRCG